MFYRDKIEQTFQNMAVRSFFQKFLRFSDKSIGTILMLHRVDYINEARFDCNENLKVSPEFLELLIVRFKKQGFSFISIDEMYDVLRFKKDAKKLIVLTLDDGYRDNIINGLPIFKKHSVPFVVYVSTGMIEKKFVYWWYLLEDILLQNDSVVLSDGSKYTCKNKKDKERVFMMIREKIMKIHPDTFKTSLPQLFPNHSIDIYKYNDILPLSWKQIQSFKDEPLATIGSHTHSHIELDNYTKERNILDINKAQDLFKQKANIEPEHFCYPYGTKAKRAAEFVGSMNFKTAVTASPGNIYARHVDDLFLLPRFFVTEKSNPDLFGQMIWYKYRNK